MKIDTTCYNLKDWFAYVFKYMFLYKSYFFKVQATGVKYIVHH